MPEPALPLVDVVILTWNDGDLLEKAVSSVLRSEGCAVRVFVIDNASDVPAEVVDDDRVEIVHNTENAGVARGRNQGAALGTAPVVVVLDSDAEVLPRTLIELLVPLREDPEIAVAVPVYADQRPTEAAGKAPTLRVKVDRALDRRDDYESLSPPDGPMWEVDFGIGACQAVRRVAFESLGGYDESIHFGPEDVDFCLRAKDLGWSIVQVGTATCIHPARRRFRKVVTRRGLAHLWSILKFLWRHRRRLR